MSLIGLAGQFMAARQGGGGPLFSEDFTGSNGAEVNGTTTDVGGLTWTAQSGDGIFELDGSSNLECSSANHEALTVDSGEADVDIMVTGFVNSSASNHAFGVWVRWVDANNWVRFIAQGSGPLRLIVSVGGSANIRDASTISSIDNTPHTLRLTVSGVDLVGYWDGTQEVSYSLDAGESAALSGETTHGPHIRQVNARIDSVDCYAFGDRP